MFGLRPHFLPLYCLPNIRSYHATALRSSPLPPPLLPVCSLVTWETLLYFLTTLCRQGKIPFMKKLLLSLTVLLFGMMVSQAQLVIKPAVGINFCDLSKDQTE